MSRKLACKPAKKKKQIEIGSLFFLLNLAHLIEMLPTSDLDKAQDIGKKYCKSEKMMILKNNKK